MWGEPTAAGPTWAEHLEAFCTSQRSPATARAYRQAVVSFHASRSAPTSITMRDVVGYRDELRAAGRSAATVQARLAAVSSWFRFLRRQPLPDGSRLLRDNPAEDVAAGRVQMYGRAHPVAEDAFTAMIRVMGATLADVRTVAWLTVHVLTGRRRAEVANMQWENFEMRGRSTIVRYIRKGGIEDTFDLPAAALAALERWRVVSGGATEGSVWGVSESTLVRSLKEAAVRAGVPPSDVRIHGLRHLAAKLKVEAGGTLLVLQRWLRHLSAATTGIYLQALEESKDEQSDAITKRLFGG